MLRFIGSMSRSTLIAIALCIAVALGVVDWATGPLISFTLFYLFPVAIVAWFVGRREALAMSLGCALIWTIADVTSAPLTLPTTIEAWNALVRVAFFFVVTWTLSSTREAAAREEALARSIQAGLLPTTAPATDGIDSAVFWEPALVVSGDTYDFPPAPDGRLVSTIADVSGKGIGAALLMANVQACVRLLCAQEASPATVCLRVNEYLYETTLPAQYVTFFLGSLDVVSRKLRYVNAGHLPPVVLRPEGPPVHLAEGGPPLGLFEDVGYSEGEIELRSGDRLVLFTDGITECWDRRGNEFGVARLIETLTTVPFGARASQIRDAALTRLRAFRYGPPLDDQTLVVLVVR
jgi:sigma-B regulation protein RsbU (phosphoserine phosphatase)